MPHCYENSRVTWDHIVLLPTDRGDVPAFTPNQLKLVAYSI